MLDFQLFCTHCVALQAMNSARRSALANNAAMMSCTQAITLMLHLQYTKENKGKLWQNHDAKHCNCCSWQKDTSLDEATSLKSEEIKPVVLAIIELHLFENEVTQSVNRKFAKQKYFKYCYNFFKATPMALQVSTVT